MIRRGARTVACLALLLADAALAIPPLVSGDVPTAAKGRYEVFAGYVVKNDRSATTWEIPFWELVYGLTDRQELTIEAPVVHRDGPGEASTGVGDVVIGTKLRLIGLPESDSGLSASVEIKLATGDHERGLGSGAVDVDLRTRWARQISADVVYLNIGHTWIGEPDGERLDNTWFCSAVWDHRLGQAARLLTEIYGKTDADPAAPSRLAATAGIKWKVRPKQQFQSSIGRSLRPGAEGGPKVRVYTGWRWDF